MGGWFVNDKKLYEEAKILRGWGRSSAVFNESEDIKKDFLPKFREFNMTVSIYSLKWDIILFLQKYQRHLIEHQKIKKILIQE